VSARLLVAPHQFEKAQRVAQGVNAAHFVGVNRADRHRGDAKPGATRDDQHLGFVLKTARPIEEVRSERAADHAIAALGIRHLLTTEPADAATHVTVNCSPNEWHFADVVHSRADKQGGWRRARGRKEAADLFRQMLAVGVEQHDEPDRFIRQPVAQPAFDRFAFAAIYRMHDDFRAGRASPGGGGIGRSVVDDEDVIELRANPLGDPADVDFLMIRRDNSGDVAAIERQAGLRSRALHR
jgi:hypothetical protein